VLIGVDVGGTNLRVGVIDGLEVVHEQRVQADFSGLCRSRAAGSAQHEIQDLLAKELADAIRLYPDVRAIGLGFPGFIDPRSGRIAQSPNLPGLLDVDLATPLQTRLGLPVVIENDALAAAYGEYHLAGLRDGGMIYFGLGTGVGGGLISAGRPFPGEHGMAMEVGHLIVEPGGRLCGCGNRGCLEQYASASGVVISYFEDSGQQLSAHEIAQRGRAGDPAAQDALNRAGSALAQALAHILKVVDVSHVIIGGGMSESWPQLAPSFERRLEADLIPVLRGKVRVQVSRAGDQAGMLGAALLAARKLA
jgi:glucokinase